MIGLIPDKEPFLPEMPPPAATGAPLGS